MTEGGDEQRDTEPPRGEGAASAVTATGVQPFFDRGDRRMHLDQLRHLSQWSRRILLVTGPRGVGKSALYRQLSASLEPRAKATRINGTLVSGTREILNAMVQGFGLAAPADADTQLLRGLVGEHAREQEASDRFCVVLIDDAELLEFRALEQLVALVHGSPMRLVLFGEVRLVPAVERVAEAARVGWHEIRLTGFNYDDARAYLEWRFQQQGLESFPFTDTQVREIVRLSEGIPGRIDQMANVLLARIQSAGSGPSGYRFPPLHRAVLAVLVVALAFLYLIWQPEPDPVQTAEPAAPRSEPAPGPAESPADALDGLAERAAEGSADSSAESSAESSDEGPAESLVEGAAEVAASTGAEPDSPNPNPNPAGADVGDRGGDASSDLDADPASAPESDRVAAAGPAPATPVDRQAPAAAPVAEPRRTAPPAAAPAVAEAVDSPATDAAAAAATTGAPESVPDQADPEGPQNAAWIMRQPAGNYTLQLVSFSTGERADEYLSGQDHAERFARYRLQRDGRILHVVIYGSFADRAAAQEAAADLPDSVGSVQPWIRAFSQIQAGVRTALQR